MDRLTQNKIVLITRKTRLENLLVRYNTIPQAKFYIEHLGSDFSDYMNEDKQYKDVVTYMITSLETIAHVQVVDREFLPNFLFGNDDIVVVVGQDGLVANTLKYLNAQPLIGVNPDSKRWDGVLLPFSPEDLHQIASDCFHEPIDLKQSDSFKWDSRFLYYTVREPYLSKWTSARFVFGKIDQQNTFKVLSQMPEDGVIFSDGVENDYLQFNSGMEATVGIADKKGMLVI